MTVTGFYIIVTLCAAPIGHFLEHRSILWNQHCQRGPIYDLERAQKRLVAHTICMAGQSCVAVLKNCGSKPWAQRPKRLDFPL